MPISAVDTISLAFQHTKRQLIQPFRFWQWTRLALVGLLAGEMGSSGGANFPTSIPNIPQQGGSSRHFLGSFPHIDPAILGAAITVAVISFLVLLIVFAYISSVMRFVLFDSIIARECHIRASWSRRQGIGWKFFLWNLGIMFATLALMVILVGIPAAIGFAAGWFKSPSDHLPVLIVGGILLFFVLIAFFIVAAVVHVMTKDFVVPQMALEGIGAVEGWRRLLAMLKGEKGGYAVYIGMKIVLAIGAGIVIGIATFIVLFVVALPSIAAAILAVIVGKNVGLDWNVFTITAAVVAGCILFAVFFYLVALISVPAIVFFPAYSIYFFAPRYRPLSLLLYPPPPGINPDDNVAPQEPPPLPPTPQMA
ncbi:MAG TPA: hypothetical protein VGG04_02505 [Candidatus Sulfotelmatobacter sp.]